MTFGNFWKNVHKSFRKLLKEIYKKYLRKDLFLIVFDKFKLINILRKMKDLTKIGKSI